MLQYWLNDNFVSSQATRSESWGSYKNNKRQSACVDVAVGWANGSIVNPTLMPSKSVSRRADSRQQSATHSQDRKQSNKKNLTWKHPSVGQFIAPFVVDCRYRSESTLQIDTPYGRWGSYKNNKRLVILTTHLTRDNARV